MATSICAIVGYGYCTSSLINRKLKHEDLAPIVLQLNQGRPYGKGKGRGKGKRVVVVRSQKGGVSDNVAVINGAEKLSGVLQSGSLEDELARVLSSMRQREEKGRGSVRVAYQGCPGAYSEAAAIMAHPGCEGVPCKGYEDAIWAVESRRADRAILPVESTLEGSVVRNYDLLVHHSLHIVQEIQLFVHYCLLVVPGSVRRTCAKLSAIPWLWRTAGKP